MTAYKIRSIKELLVMLTDLSKETDNYLRGSDQMSWSLPKHQVTLEANLEINENISRMLRGKIKYFSGEFEGNNHTITVSSNNLTPLFSSMYFAKFSNLNIHSVKGSRGLLLAHDALTVEVNNVKVTGSLKLDQPTGGLFKTSSNCKFNDCIMAIETKSISKSKLVLDDDSPYSIFGGFVGTDLGNTKFTRCTVTGSINSEVKVGGFVGVSKGTSFEDCLVDNLSLVGLREVGCYVGRVENPVNIKSCKIKNSKVTSNVYGGLVIGRGEAELTCDDLIIDESVISSETASSFIGGVSGSSRKIVLNDCHFKANVAGSFVVAGVCPDSCETSIIDSTLDLVVTASGYPPMMIHAYELTKDCFLSSRGNEHINTVTGSDISVRLDELGVTGLINPFGEVIV